MPAVVWRKESMHMTVVVAKHPRVEAIHWGICELFKEGRDVLEKEMTVNQCDVKSLVHWILATKRSLY